MRVGIQANPFVLSSHLVLQKPQANHEAVASAGGGGFYAVY